MRRIQIASSILFVSLVGSTALGQTPLSHDFTYQGQIKLSNAPLNATADFQFKLFGAVTGGTQIGSTQSINNTAVANGLFTVTLNFGVTAFTGDKRWIEIAARSPAGAGTFTTLTPRQPLTAAPYAMYALSGPGSGGPWTVNGSNVFCNNSGNVGIGTVAPVAKLHVKGPGEGIRMDSTVAGDAGQAFMSFRDSNGLRTGYVGDGSTGDTSIFLNADFGDVVLNTGVGRALVVKNGGNVGIGTTTPATKLHIDDNFDFPAVILVDSGVVGPNYSAMEFRDRGVQKWGCGKDTFNNFYISDPFSPTYHMTILQNGNVGLGTNSPAARLHVNGTTRTNVLEITGADLAEKFPTSEEVKPGMVVAIDAKNPGKLCVARGSYDRRVAGVVSGANDFSAGAILGNLPGHEDAPPIALSGRVYVHCDAAGAPIQSGDLLTTSDTPGHAMKATDRERSHGAVIGKAMTSLDSGRGLVLVLVNLQ